MKKVALALCGALLFGGIFAGCNFDPWKSVAIGDFIYSTNQKSDSGDGCDYAIIGLSEEGKKKDTLVFPSFTNGHKIASIGADFVKKNSGEICSENAKKVYFCGNPRAEHTDFKKAGTRFENAEIFIAVPSSSPWQARDYTVGNTNYVEKKVKEYLDGENENEHIKAANLVYYVGDDDCYFVDYIENATVTIIPPEPHKDGYAFGGWYKDTEYLEKWDFEKDLVPAGNIEYDEKGNPIYFDTKLYAKWI